MYVARNFRSLSRLFSTHSGAKSMTMTMPFESASA